MTQPDGNEVAGELGAQIGDQAVVIAVLRSRLRIAEETIAELRSAAPPES